MYANAALQTAAANEQHYELPTEYFLKALGPHRKCATHSCVVGELPTFAQPQSAGSTQ